MRTSEQLQAIEECLPRFNSQFKKMANELCRRTEMDNIQAMSLILIYFRDSIKIKAEKKNDRETQRDLSKLSCLS